MIGTKKIMDLLLAGETIDLRADGKAGCGLVTTLQIFAEAAGGAVSMNGQFEVQEWPLFSSARKGANVRGYLRIGRGPILRTCQIETPQVALLLTEKTGEELDFASGASEGIFIVNSLKSPEEIGEKFRLRGEIFTVPGDRLGQEFLGHPIPNISVLAALCTAVPVISAEQTVQALVKSGKKRRLPERAIEANKRCFVESLPAVRSALVPGRPEWRHPLPKFSGYRGYPTAAQSRLRTSLGNKTANYARTGKVLSFWDPEDRCTGCSLCIINCPEGIIRFEPDEKRGIRVTGADVDQFCKLCRECIEVCPVDLFQEKTVNG